MSDVQPVTEDELRHLAWQDEQVRIAERRADAMDVLDGDPDARERLEARWAPLSKRSGA